MNARCTMLASKMRERAMRCPTTPFRFHFHGIVAGGYSPLTGAVPCEHRHKTVQAAIACSEGN